VGGRVIYGSDPFCFSSSISSSSTSSLLRDRISQTLSPFSDQPIESNDETYAVIHESGLYLID